MTNSYRYERAIYNQWVRDGEPGRETAKVVATDSSPVHTISATTVMNDPISEPFLIMSMCGVVLGTFGDAVDAGHVIGNYAPRETIARTVTCPDCLARNA